MKAKMFLFNAFIITILFAGDNNGNPQFFIFNSEKAELLAQSASQVDSIQNAEKQKKSVFQAALMSSVLPGSGEFYAGSVWRAAVFTGLEVIGWTTYFIYESKGDDKDVQMRDFGDEHWSERRYWSKVYDDASTLNRWEYELLQLDDESIIIEQDYTLETIERLREVEDDDAMGYTHRLPETRDQQYYEMIYKYLNQFGNGWDDAEFGVTYDGYEDNLTPNMRKYRDIRNDMNHLYDIATAVTNAILFNHVISAIDAALVTRNYNRSLRIQSSIERKKYFDQYVTMYGINISW